MIAFVFNQPNVGVIICFVCALGKSSSFANKSVIILENSPPYQQKNWKNSPYDNRVSAITPGSRDLLKG